MHPVPRLVRRIGMAALAAVAIGGAAQAAPAAANTTGFGAGNLPGMEIVEGGTLDYAVSLAPCPQGYECNLFMKTGSAHAIKDVDFTSSSVTPLKTYRGPGDGRMIGVHRIKTIDDAHRERDEPLWFEARVDYYPGGCPNGRPGSSASCLPESSFRWLAPITIKDNDARRLRPFELRRYVYRAVQGADLMRPVERTSTDVVR